jgi:hypothetical protein
MGITFTKFEDAGDANYVIRIDKGEQLVIVCDVGGHI